jgi:hypothetical protein
MKAQSRFNRRGRLETCLYTVFWISDRATFSVRDPSIWRNRQLGRNDVKNRQRICETPTIAVAVAFNRRLAVDGKFFCVLIAKTKGAVVK